MPTDIIVPAEQEGTKAVLKAWLKKRGDSVRIDEPVVEIETDKVAVEIAATANGILSEILVEEGADVAPGSVLGRIGKGSVATPETAAAPPVSPKGEPNLLRNAPTSAQLSPGVRRLLSEHGLKPEDVPYGERLTREDIEAEVARRAEQATASVSGARFVPHDSMRRRIAEHMAHSMRTAPHVTALFEADFSAIIAHRQKHRAEFAHDGANLTFTPYFVAASAEAMKVAAQVNGRWLENGIEISDDVNIGIVTALGDRGLIAPVIHSAQSLSLLAIAQRLTELTEKTRGGRLSASDVQNGTFSISNHGVSGSLLAAPIIIHQPQSAVLGVGKLQKRAVVRETDGSDAIEIRPMAYVTLTIDHRVLDGHQCNTWMTRFVEIIENWR